MKVENFSYSSVALLDEWDKPSQGLLHSSMSTWSHGENVYPTK